LTSEKFDQDLWDVYDDQDKKKKEKNKSFSGGAGGRLFKKAPLLYRTGDLARWLPGGEIEFLGRIDYQVKIRGVRIELEEIENLLLTFPGIKEACVICKTDESGNNNLCAYIISNEEVPVPGIRKHLLKHLPGYMIPVHFVFLEKMPLTPNGKIDRKALPDPEIKIPAGNIAPRNQTEKALAEVWSEVLGIEKDKLGIDANFFELGGHSLKAIILSTRIHKKLNIKVPLAEIFKSNTIRSLSGYIKESGSDTYTAIEIAEKREYYPLSNAQKGIFVQHHKEAGALVYNMSQILTPDYDIDPIQLTNALQKLAARHESLRTSFRVIDGQPVQVIHSQVDLNIEYYESDYSPSAINSIWHRFIKPFDLTQAPLFRVALVTGKTKKRLIMVDIHHIITDWVSTNIALKEMTALYNGNELPPITVNYKDFCIWQNRSEEKEKRKKQGEFWQHQFSGNIPVLKMPYDCERPPKRSFQGEQIKFAITEDLCVKLDEINRETGATVNMMLLAIFSILLAKYSWQEDIIIGTPAANRNHTDLENIIGVFINMLAIRNRPQKDKTFHGFLLEVKEQVLDALSNQDYHFEELVAALGLQGDVSRNPLFDVVFVMQDREVEDTNKNQNENNKPGIIPDEIEFTNSPFDLILGAAGNEKRIDLTLAYSTALYKRAAVEKMAGHYLDILRQVADNYHIIINDIQVSDIRIAPDNKMDKKDLAEFEF
jgi:acyl carrier protein